MRSLLKYHQLKQHFRTVAPPSQVPLPGWMESRIEKDLSYINHVDDSGSCKKDFFLFCHIRHSKIRFRYPIKHFTNRRVLIIKLFFRYLASRYTLPDLDFCIYFDDALESVPSWTSLPTLCFAKNRASKGPILIPDFEMLRGYERLNFDLNTYMTQFPWEAKKNAAFWRGSTSGLPHLTLENYLTAPRIKLAHLSKEHPELVDARLSQVVQSSDEVAQTLKNQGLVDTFTPIANHFAYKYLLDIDGNSSTYARLYWILFSNCLPLKQSSQNIQWYYGGLEDGQNISLFSLEQGKSDSLLSKLRFFSEHDGEAKEIAQNSHTFCLTYLNLTYTTNYVLNVLSCIREASR